MVVRKRKVSRGAKLKVCKTVCKTKQKVQPRKSKKQELDESLLNRMIQERAYYIWEEKQRPADQDFEIWVQAKKDILRQVK